ncbi:type II toxin-antitoxin system YoeB family toxin [Cyanobacterium aponinum]|nr:type II toxin-antitoxin system YoeB family toxin [Cyanobacterium aponinum]PHV60952.1 hypothetical protein CSQ80_18195 [Cyanobacterium aponinum IPPAS B-1201]
MLRLGTSFAIYVKDIKRNPFDGIGKPEPLKFDFSGLWSRLDFSTH